MTFEPCDGSKKVLEGEKWPTWSPVKGGLLFEPSPLVQIPSPGVPKYDHLSLFFWMPTGLFLKWKCPMSNSFSMYTSCATNLTTSNSSPLAGWHGTGTPFSAEIGPESQVKIGICGMPWIVCYWVTPRIGTISDTVRRLALTVERKIVFQTHITGMAVVQAWNFSNQ